MSSVESNKTDLINVNPRKAIRKLSGPIMLSLIFLMLNNIIDSAWVSGLGAAPLAAVGFVTPLYMAVVGIGAGLGSGANSSIARFLGKGDNDGANNSATHAIILILILTVVMTVAILLFLQPILIAMGASKVIELATEYGTWIILGLFSFLIPNCLGSILRSERHVKRATYPLIGSAIVNMIIDPIFIFSLNMGVSGAAIATIISQTIVGIVPMVYWIFIKKDIQINVNLTSYKTDLAIYKDILLVGIPASLEEIIMAVLSAVINGILSLVAGTAAVAVFSAAWRVVGIGLTPAMGVGMASITVIGTAYGALNLKNLKESFTGSMEYSIFCSIIVFVLFYIFAGNIAELFSYAQTSANLAPFIADATRLLGIYILAMTFGMAATYYFQSIGKGVTSLIMSLIRELILIISSIFVLVFVLGWGVLGVYWGLVIGAVIGSLISYTYAKYNLNKITS